MLLAGCGEDEAPEPIVQAAPQAPPPPPPPSLTPISDLMAQYNIDQRVVLQERFAPDSTDAARVAVLRFFDSFARADADGLRVAMNPEDQMELDALTSGDRFDMAVADIEEIESVAGTRPTATRPWSRSSRCPIPISAALGVPRRRDGQAEFTSGPTPIDVMDNLSGDNWVSSGTSCSTRARHRVQLDEELEIPQRDLTNDEGSPQTGGGGGGSPNGPGRGRSPQRGTPIAPPSHDPSRPGG